MMLNAPVDAMITLLTNSLGFQTLINGNAGAAALRIHKNFLPAPADNDKHTKAELQALRPFAMVWTRESQGWRARRDSSPAGFKIGGSIMIRIEWDIPPGTTDQVAAATFEDHLSRILRDESGETGILQAYQVMNIYEVQLLAVYRSLPEDTPAIGDCYAAELQVDWGLQ